MTNRLFTENENIKENVKNDIFLKQQVERIKSDSEKFANKEKSPPIRTQLCSTTSGDCTHLRVCLSTSLHTSIPLMVSELVQ